LDLFLILGAYVAFGVFCWRVIWRFLLRLRSEPDFGFAAGHACGSRVLGILDIVLLRRLFLVNKGLWVGEWTFHITFVLVSFRHLRYVLEPGWGCLRFIEPFGLAAGYVLPFSLLYILLYRLVLERGQYVSKSNLFLTTLMLVISSTGVLLHGYFRVDVVEVKSFILTLFALSPVDPPANRLFLVHFLSALVFLPFVPSHLFAAPFSMVEARRRETLREDLLHG